MVGDGIVFLFWVGSGLYDLKWKKIPLWFILLGILAGVVFKVIQIKVWGPESWSGVIADLIPGICAICMARIWEDRIGVGDGLVLLVTGLFLSAEQTFFVAVVGLLLATLFGVGMLVLKRGTLQTTLPFVPFLAVGGVIVLWSNAWFVA